MRLRGFRCQTRSLPDQNPGITILVLTSNGGFTDGDRGLYLCHHLAPSDKPFFLFGYDFGSEIGEFSKESLESNLPMTPQKHLKMQLCHQLIETLKIKKRRAILFFGRSPEIRSEYSSHNW